jgi:glycosyltransferase involved in cell wall biosynthesis|tara:strand:- start:492 stop:1667 length:1176 start_codon:yes stop_codon:yes gene_type:complete
MSNIGVLMVTGVYHPEISGAANQCRLLVKTLSREINFSVLTTTRNPDLPRWCQIDNTDVFRVLIQRKGVINYYKAMTRMASLFLFHRKTFDIVHLHGFSYKSAFLTALSKIYHKKVIIKMTSVGHDDPFSIRQRGFLLNYFFSKADAYVSLSPQFERIYRQSRLPSHLLKQISNGVDTNLFRPVTNGEKTTLRDQLGLPQKMKLILFVGHFSREKCPDILLETWKRFLAEEFPDTGIVFVGSSNPNHYEVDADLVRDMQKITESYLNKRVFFIERTHEIEKYFQAVDMFVLPSLREGLPNALLEAMACGLPVITSRLEGVTDWIVEDGKNGLLLKSVIGDDLGKALISMLKDEIQAHLLGLKARETVLERFSMEKVAEEYLELYRRLTPLA